MTRQEVSAMIHEAIGRNVVIAPKEWLSTREACAHLNCSPAKLRQLIEAGEVVAANKGKGRSTAISRKSINQFFERNIYKPNK